MCSHSSLLVFGSGVRIVCRGIRVSKTFTMAMSKIDEYCVKSIQQFVPDVSALEYSDIYLMCRLFKKQIVAIPGRPWGAPL